MITKIGSKLSLAFGILFTIVFLLSGSIVYYRVDKIITQVVDNNLDSISDLIKRIVIANIEKREGEVRKDLIVAEYFLSNGLVIDNGKKILMHTRNIQTEETRYTSYPVINLGSEVVSGSELLIDRIAEKTNGIVGIYQFTDDGFVLVSTNKVYDSGDVAIGELIPPEASIYTLIKREKTYYGRDYFNHKWYFTGYKLLYSKDKIIGALFVAREQVRFDELKSDILSIKIGKSSSPYIIDQMTRVVVQPDGSKSNFMSYDDMIKIIFKRNGRIEYDQKNPGTGKEERYVAFFKYIPDINWIVIVGSSMNDFYGPLFAVRIVFLFIFGTGILLSIIMSIVLGHQITKPIVQIKDKIKEISEGDASLTNHLEISSNDEIGLLADYFNNFMGKLRKVNEVDRHEIEVLLKDAQMVALQAQINPHFLYNTLETIRFMISLKDDRAVDMVQLLADLFRISISKGDKYVTIKEEMEHIRLYLSIQKIRYSDRFSVEIDLPSELESLYCVKFILQPIVENSVHHGFKELEKNGVIKIVVRKKSGNLEIIVADNGCGIDRKKCANLQESLRTGKKTDSIGLQNVHSRIQLHFGIQYGINIKCGESGGTSVSLTLPVIGEKPRSDFFEEPGKALLFF